MHSFHIYKNGSLPFPAQQFRSPHVQVLRVEYWLITQWNHGNLAAPYWRLYWNPDRGARVEFEGHHWALDPSRLLLIPPHTPFKTSLPVSPKQPHKTNIMRGHPYQPLADGQSPPRLPDGFVRHFFVHFTAGPLLDRGAPQIFSCPVDHRVHTLLETLTGRLITSQTEFDHQRTFGLMELIHHALEKVPESYWPHPPNDPRILRVMQHIDANHGLSLHNRDFARMASMNPNAFVRLFKEKTNRTPLDYLKHLRIEKASILLLQTDRSIDEIASSCGFCDRNHFSRIFQKQTGTGPATYRRSRRQ